MTDQLTISFIIVRVYERQNINRERYKTIVGGGGGHQLKQDFLAIDKVRVGMEHFNISTNNKTTDRIIFEGVALTGKRLRLIVAEALTKLLPKSVNF